jgi:hypothetical protein
MNDGFTSRERGKHCVEIAHVGAYARAFEVDAHEVVVAREVGAQARSDGSVGSRYGNL